MLPGRQSVQVRPGPGRWNSCENAAGAERLCSSCFSPMIYDSMPRLGLAREPPVAPGRLNVGVPRLTSSAQRPAHKHNTLTHILWNRLQIVKLSIDQRHKLGEPDSINLFRTPQESARPGPSPKCKCKIFFEHNHIIWCFAHEQHGWACLPGD